MMTNNVEEAILLADRIVPVMAGPPATLGAPIPVTLAAPAHRGPAARTTSRPSHVRAHVVATLTASLGRRRSRPAATRGRSPAADAILEVGK